MTQDILLRRAVTAALVAGTMAGPLEDTPELVRLHGLATGDAGSTDTSTETDAAAGDPDTCSGWRVTEDDTRLSLIAQRALGEAARWSEIAELNDLRDGRNYQLGDCLSLP